MFTVSTPSAHWPGPAACLMWKLRRRSCHFAEFKTGSRILKCVLELSRERSPLLRLGLVKPGLLSQAPAF